MKTIGAIYTTDGHCRFTVWAPEKESVTVRIVYPEKRELALQRTEWGYFGVEADAVLPGTRYYVTLNNGPEYPDPASQFQPEDVHGPSEIVDHSAYSWHDQHWRGRPFRELVFYQLHVGTFTPEGTFEAIIPRLDDLGQVGINALQLLPISQFPGSRNWGYDGVFPYSVQHSYGGPNGLKKLVDACHTRGMAIFLDVVYNHMGPEGNYFSQFGPYFTSKYHTPWGDALNFDRDWSDGVRDFFANNPLFWFEHYHIDGLRLDAIHEIFDMGAISIWELIHTNVKQLEQQLGRALYLVAESDLNTPRVTQLPSQSGMGFDAQWLDDFHHMLHVLINRAGQEKYADFNRMEQLAKAYTDGFVLSGDYVSFRKRQFGRPSVGVPGDQFVVFNQNHDQVGNQSGERLSVLVDFDRQKVAAAALLLSPYVPLLFMGEEYADDAPFYYFVSHTNPALIKLIQEGRKKDFARFMDSAEPPDPAAEDTFLQSKIQWHKRSEGHHQLMLDWHRSLIELRRLLPALQNVNKPDVRVTVLGQAGFVLHRQTTDGQQHVLCLFNLSDDPIPYTLPVWVNSWTRQLDSTEGRWQTDKPSGRKGLPAQVDPSQTVRLLPGSVAVYTGQLKKNP